VPVANGAANHTPLLDTSVLLGHDDEISVQALIDQTLEVVHGEFQRLGDRIGIPPGPGISLELLRHGPLGQDLIRLAMVAHGLAREPQELVLEAIDAVLQLLFWPAAGDDYQVPRTFWETELGRLLARAKFRAFPVAALVGITSAATMLGVSRPTIYRWMDNRMLDYVHDEVSGRTFVLRDGLDRYRATTTYLSA
jgi:hypothetical protein